VKDFLIDVALFPFKLIVFAVLMVVMGTVMFGPTCIAIGLTLGESPWFAFTLIPAFGWALAIGKRAW